MDILVFCSENSERAGAFQKFVAAQGHEAKLISAGDPLPPAELRLGGVVFFDPGATNLPALLQVLREQLRYLSVPLLVVSNQASSAFQTLVLNAGADLICAPTTPDASIFQELQARCLAQPLTPEIRAQLAEPLTTAVRQTLRDMTDTHVVVRSMYQRTTQAALGDIMATLSITSPLDGSLSLCFSMGTAEALARRVLADVAAEQVPALIQDCMGEIANVVAGQAKALLAGTAYHFVFSTPVVTTDIQGMTMKQDMDSLVIALDSTLGALALQLCRTR